MTRSQRNLLGYVAGAICAAAVVAAAVPAARGDGPMGELVSAPDEAGITRTPSDDALRLAWQPAEPPPPVVVQPPDPPPRVQPVPAPQPPTPPARTRLALPTASTVATLPRYRRSRFRLASVPNMYGDTLPPGPCRR